MIAHKTKENERVETEEEGEMLRSGSGKALDH
jgi:hypothetical protein